MGWSVIIFLEMCILYHTSCMSQLHLNDECTINRSNDKGICRPLTDCSILVNDIKKHSFRPTFCGFHDGKEIVCCPNRRKSEESSTKNRIFQQSLYQYFSSFNECFNCNSIFI